MGCNGAGGFGIPTSWHCKQEVINSSINLSIFGNQVFSLMRALVLDKPKCPACAMFNALFRSDFGNTSKFPFKITLSQTNCKSFQNHLITNCKFLSDFVKYHEFIFVDLWIVISYEILTSSELRSGITTIGLTRGGGWSSEWLNYSLFLKFVKFSGANETVYVVAVG